MLTVPTTTRRRDGSRGSDGSWTHEGPHHDTEHETDDRPLPALHGTTVVSDDNCDNDKTRSFSAATASENLRISFDSAIVYYAIGRKKESDSALAKLIAKDQMSVAIQIAEVYAFRKEPDQAFEWLDRAHVQHDTGVAEIKWKPLKNLCGDPAQFPVCS